MPLSLDSRQCEECKEHTWAVVTAWWYLRYFVLGHLTGHHRTSQTSWEQLLTPQLELPSHWQPGASPRVMLSLYQNWFSDRFPYTLSLLPLACHAVQLQQQGVFMWETYADRTGPVLRWALMSRKSLEPSSFLNVNVSGGLFSYLTVTDY